MFFNLEIFKKIFKFRFFLQEIFNNFRIFWERNFTTLPFAYVFNKKLIDRPLEILFCRFPLYKNSC